LKTEERLQTKKALP